MLSNGHTLMDAGAGVHRMRLQKSRVSAEEELVAHINAGYQLLNYLKASYYSKRRAGSFDPNKDNLLYQNSIAEWSAIVAQSLSTIFPTELEKNQFIHARAQIRGYPSGQ